MALNKIIYQTIYNCRTLLQNYIKMCSVRKLINGFDQFDINVFSL